MVARCHPVGFADGSRDGNVSHALKEWRYQIHMKGRTNADYNVGYDSSNTLLGYSSSIY